MRENPSGRSLLEERPDLCAALNDMPALGAMSEGSLGRAYYDFMDHPETIPGYMLSGMIYKDGWFDTVPMDPELRWAFERWIQTHDLMHVVSGYGADLAGEGLNIYFTLAYNMGISWRLAYWTPFGLAPRLMRPSVGRVRWVGYLREAWERGIAAREHLPFESVPWEQLLSQPIDSVRSTLGLPPLSEPAMNSAEWSDESFFTTKFLASNVDYESVRGLKAAVSAGVPLRALMQADTEIRGRVEEAALAGAELGALTEALGI
jgi:ubiquinone biosynthesis protein Coq4